MVEACRQIKKLLNSDEEIETIFEANARKNYLGGKVLKIKRRTGRSQNNIVLLAESSEAPHLVAKFFVRQVD
jgi:hypothetical protein